MKRAKLNIDNLIEIVNKGGAVKTGVDIYNKKGLLLLEKDVLVTKVTPLLLVKNSGIQEVAVLPEKDGGVWDKNGRPLKLPDPKDTRESGNRILKDNVEEKIAQIYHLKEEAQRKHRKATESYKKIIVDISRTGGEFDVQDVEETVDELFDFVSRSDNAFSYLAREIMSFDDYLFNHSTNVCAIATAVLKKFNDNFNSFINNYLRENPEAYIPENNTVTSYMGFLPEEMRSLSLGFFLHDVGKILIPDKILNKKGPLTDKEFALVQKHSYEKGPEILRKNNLDDVYAHNIATYHHSSLYAGEGRCYPEDKLPIEIPLYVKICKFADIYDAMTSKRCYKEAMNPTAVVTEVFRKYKDRDHMLQYILHSFIKTVGIYPPTSIISLVNGQMAYVIDSDGPIVIPFTDKSGNPLGSRQEPVNLADEHMKNKGVLVDRRKPLQKPLDVYDLLPGYIKEFVITP